MVRAGLSERLVRRRHRNAVRWDQAIGLWPGEGPGSSGRLCSDPKHRYQNCRYGESKMKITSIKTIITRPPIRHPGTLGVGKLEHVDAVIVSIETDTGLSGVGECSPWAVFA